MISTFAKIILASSSPIRKSLLEKSGISFEVMESPFDEEKAKQDLLDASPEDRAIILAKGKAQAVSEIDKNAYVIGADQVCALESEGVIFSKPKKREVAIAQLLAMSGKTHTQISGISICKGGVEIWSHIEKSFILMRNLTEKEITHYVDMDEPLLCAGSYQLEKNAKHLFASITGSDDNILGLPMVPILNFFYSKGVISL